MPIKAVQRRMAGNQDVRAIMVGIDPAYDNKAIQQTLSALLRERRGLTASQDDNFGILDAKQISDTISGTVNTLTVLMIGAIAGISLLVGGIGIMNIMLVSVTERTREIGIRLAIGALGEEVLLQFLVEAIVLSCLGGADRHRAGVRRVRHRGAGDGAAVPLRRPDQRHELCLLGADRRRLRLFPGTPRRRTQPDRRAPLRLNVAKRRRAR